MLILTRTPVRISFFGGGTDYPDYYLPEGKRGAVLGTAISQYTYVSLNTLGRFFEHHIRIGYSKTELVKRIDEIQHPSIRECLKFLGFSEEETLLDIHIFSDLPAKTGLGSSSSFTVGFLNALTALLGRHVSKQKLAEDACHVEQHLIPENVGSQDQFHASYGGFNVMQFSAAGIALHPVVLTQEKRHLLQSHLLLFYTGLTRFASDVLKEQIEKTKSTDNDAFLSQMFDMVFEAERILLSQSGEEMVKHFGRLLHESWVLKKQLSSKISNPHIDALYQRALEAGAYGGKLCGAGSGGFLALFAPPEKKAEIRKALDGLLEVPIQFESEGTKIIYVKD